MLFVQEDRRVLVPVDDRQIRIGIQCFGGQRRMNIVRFGPGEPTLAGAQTDEYELIVLAGLEPERATVGPVREDRLANLAQRQRTPEPGRVGGCQVAHDLTEEATQLLHR
jgi:hypothetical protein